MPVNLTSWWTEPAVVRIIAAIITQKRPEVTVRHACAASPHRLVVDLADSCSSCACFVQPKGLYVETARELALRYHVGIRRDSIKEHISVLENEIDKKEDLSNEKFDVAAAKALVVSRYDSASTPFSTEDIEKNWPGYRAPNTKKSAKAAAAAQTQQLQQQQQQQVSLLHAHNEQQPADSV